MTVAYSKELRDAMVAKILLPNNQSITIDINKAKDYLRYHLYQSKKMSWEIELQKKENHKIK